MKEGRLIGDILGCYCCGMGDWWYVKRIEDFIRQKKIRVIQEAKAKYARAIRAEKE